MRYTLNGQSWDDGMPYRDLNPGSTTNEEERRRLEALRGQTIDVSRFKVDENIGQMYDPGVDTPTQYTPEGWRGRNIVPETAGLQQQAPITYRQAYEEVKPQQTVQPIAPSNYVDTSAPKNYSSPAVYGVKTSPTEDEASGGTYQGQPNAITYNQMRRRQIAQRMAGNRPYRSI